ncbi:NAD(P)-binding protein [Pontibacter qinzhouensis]|uniref:NAD(P)-binding protein n=1 Tax=Pontibacter qinzhouensis TaxID=2603253 RepID=A0A5C8J222_9BACT|nr:NAD(P)/FAD-dependent oxidoreductase [Pontibacter qinzhouensis]TXK29676.1 NAD(P)-binding protein [Pontibacter qinzhouensis]
MTYDVVLIGSGFGSLTAAALLVKQGLKVCVLEQANYPGGCSSSYYRKGYIFETGATTLVGLDEHMPLRYLLDTLQLEIPARKLEVPMQVHLPNQQVLTRHQSLDEWILEAERVFGIHNQRAFWEQCYRISKQVWQVSLQQKSFPFSSVQDVWQAAWHVRTGQLRLLPIAFQTVEQLLKKYGLLENQLFVDFVNEQLLITAQNYMAEVNVLFGATALCYTLFGNYYIDGGLLNLVTPLVNYIQENGSSVMFRQTVREVLSQKNRYQISTNTRCFTSRFVISGLPLNNTLQLFKDQVIQQKLGSYILKSDKLNSAFSMSLVLKDVPPPTVLHHQVHVPEGLPHLKSKSVFVSFSHSHDKLRAPENYTVVSISTHLHDPESNFITDKRCIEEAIVKVLVHRGLLREKDIVYRQSATPGAWQFWTARAYGMVGGYPQYRHIKPWQMKDARLDHKGAYLCGDTVYPGQGIPGTCLSGILAAHKLLQDHKI